MKAAQAASPFVLNLSVDCARACHENCGRGCISGSCAHVRAPFPHCAFDWVLLLSAPERQVPVCQQKVTFGTVVKVIFHMFADTVLLPSLML